MSQKVLLADHGSQATALARCLRGLGYVVDVVVDGKEAVRHATGTAPQLAIVAIGLPGEPAGIDAAASIGRLGVPIVLLADGDDDPLLDRADAVKPAGYLARPVHGRQLALTVRNALARSRPGRDLGSRRRLSEISAACSTSALPRPSSTASAKASW